MAEDSKKGHRKKKAGKKVAKRKASDKKKKGAVDSDARKRNPKAFTVQARGRAKIQRMRTADKDQKRMHGMSRHIPTCRNGWDRPAPSRCMHALCAASAAMAALFTGLSNRGIALASIRAVTNHYRRTSICSGSRNRAACVSICMHVSARSSWLALLLVPRVLDGTSCLLVHASAYDAQHRGN